MLLLRSSSTYPSVRLAVLLLLPVLVLSFKEKVGESFRANEPFPFDEALRDTAILRVPRIHDDHHFGDKCITLIQAQCCAIEVIEFY